MPINKRTLGLGTGLLLGGIAVGIFISRLFSGSTEPIKQIELERPAIEIRESSPSMFVKNCAPLKVGDELVYESYMDIHDVTETHSRIYKGPVSYKFTFLGVERLDKDYAKFRVYAYNPEESVTEEPLSYPIESPPVYRIDIRPFINPDWTSQRNTFRDFLRKTYPDPSIDLEEWNVKEEGSNIIFYLRTHKRVESWDLDIVYETTAGYDKNTGVLTFQKFNHRGHYRVPFRYVGDIKLSGCRR